MTQMGSNDLADKRAPESAGKPEGLRHVDGADEPLLQG